MNKCIFSIHSGKSLTSKIPMRSTQTCMQGTVPGMLGKNTEDIIFSSLQAPVVPKGG